MKNNLKKPLRIIGIDPGYAIVGYGVLDYNCNKFCTVDYGAILTSPQLPFEQRLECIWNELSQIMEKHSPQAIAVERLFFTNNQKTGIDVAQARGVILLCGQKYGAQLFEYTPLQVKLAVVGYGKAEKNQVMQMTKTLLNLEKVPKPDDTADALAIAICHAHSSGSNINAQNLLSWR